LNLQTKIFVVLIAVIVPTFIVVALVESRIAGPLLENEIRERGISAAKALKAEIVSGQLLNQSDLSSIEVEIEEILRLHPSVFRIDVLVPDEKRIRILVSNYEDLQPYLPDRKPLYRQLRTEVKKTESGAKYWEIHVPISQRPKDPSAEGKFMGNVRLAISLKPANAILETFWKMDAISTALVTLILLVALSYSLKKTLATDKLYQLSKSQNLQLTEQVQELRQKLVTGEN